MDLRVGGKYQLRNKIGSGWSVPFSGPDVYRGVEVVDGEEVAIKLEPRKAKHPQLEYESKVYKELAGGAGVPFVRWFGIECDFNVMVMDLLGPSFEDLFKFCERKFSLKTVLMLTDQLIKRIEYVHSRQYIHRGITPENFLMGIGKRGNQVNVISFSLAKKYRDPKSEVHIQCSENKKLMSRARYTSINSHLGVERSRRDDLESIAYILLYFLRGRLPWQGLKAATEKQRLELVLKQKRTISTDLLCQGFHSEFGVFLDYCRALRFDEKPDYDYIRGLFFDLFLREGFEWDYIFDWSCERTGANTIAPASIPQSLPVLIPAQVEHDGPRDSKPERRVANWKLGKKLGSGSDGDVYLGHHIVTGRVVAIKIPRKEEDRKTLKHEAKVYFAVYDAIGVPAMRWHGDVPWRHRDMEAAYAIVVDLLGPSLEDLFDSCNCKFSLKTVLLLADQLINTIKSIHGCNYIHHEVHVVDFGVSVNFRRPGPHKRHIRYEDDLNPIGNVTFTSLNIHRHIHPSRRDDLESLAYTLIYFLRGNLPWEDLHGDGKTGRFDLVMWKKQSVSVENLCRGLPSEFSVFLNYSRTLKFKCRPDYQYVRKLFSNLFVRLGFQRDNVFDWSIRAPSAAAPNTVVPANIPLSMPTVASEAHDAHDAGDQPIIIIAPTAPPPSNVPMVPEEESQAIDPVNRPMDVPSDAAHPVEGIQPERQQGPADTIP